MIVSQNRRKVVNVMPAVITFQSSHTISNSYMGTTDYRENQVMF